MADTEAVPNHDVLILDRPVLLYPLRQPVPSCVLVGIVPRGIPFLFSKARDPQVFAGEAAALRNAAPWLSQQQRVRLRYQLVPRMLAHGIPMIRVDDLP